MMQLGEEMDNTSRCCIPHVLRKGLPESELGDSPDLRGCSANFRNKLRNNGAYISIPARIMHSKHQPTRSKEDCKVLRTSSLGTALASKSTVVMSTAQSPKARMPPHYDVMGLNIDFCVQKKTASGPCQLLTLRAFALSLST